MRGLILGLAGALLISTPALAQRVDVAPPIELTDLCGSAVEASTEARNPRELQNLFVGRLELAMQEAKLSNNMKEATRLMCASYHRGYIKGLEYAVGLLQKIEKPSLDEQIRAAAAIPMPGPPRRR